MITERQKLRIIEYKNKCKELGFEYIEFKNSHIKCKCNKCNFINKPFFSGNLMRGNICCSQCFTIKYKEKYKNKCKELGFELIEYKKNKIKCKCNKCNM